MIEAFIEVKGDKRIQKKLPLTWTLSSLKNFLAKTLKIPVGVIFKYNLDSKINLQSLISVA